MLEQSIERLNKLSPDMRAIAEHMAETTLTSEFVENLMPADQAETIARDHREQNTEEWLRAVSAAVSSLLALRHLGYALTRRTDV